MIMKKYFFFAAIAAIGLASCSNDETIASQATSESNTISFRPLVNNVTRAANGTGLKTAWEDGDILHVTAIYKSAKYFQDDFTKGTGDGSAAGFNSTTKHYWPNDLSTNSITFTAFWNVAQKTYASSGDENSLAAAYTVPDAVASQKDLLLAKKTVTSKPTDGGVTLNFRHMLSQIIVKVANDESDLKVVVSGVRVGYVAKTGTFTYSGGVTDTQVQDATNTASATLIPRTNWTPTAATAATQLHEQTVSATLTGTTAATDLTDFSSWILLPQQLTAATDYTARETSGAVTSATDPKLNGAYLALKMTVKSADDAATIVPEQWCYWPINTEWLPGYKYTYTINAGSGGYQPTDQNNDTGLDPVLSGTFIWFTPSCTIDTWVESAITVDDPTSL
jgi:hypothetical protein